MSRTRRLVVLAIVVVIVLAVIYSSIMHFQANAPTSTTSGASPTSSTTSLNMNEKTDILNGIALEPATKVVQDYCIKNSREKVCQPEVSSHVPELHHNHAEPVPESPITLPTPGPCNTLCVTWDSETDVEVKNTSSGPITVLVVTVSLHNDSAEPIPVSPLQVISPGQTVAVPLLYANGSHIGIILYYT